MINTDKQNGKQSPANSPRGEASKLEREERSARALRDNLRRRKAQIRERQEGFDEADVPGDDSPDT